VVRECTIRIMANNLIQRPQAGEYAAFFEGYIHLVPEGDIRSILDAQLREVHELLDGLSDADSLAHHPPYTWSIRQVLGHVTDAERVFGHRALWIARGDTKPLAGFEQDQWMQTIHFDRWPLAELVKEFDLVRRSHLALFAHLDDQAWLRRGVVSNHPATPRAFAYIIAGHTKHHVEIVRKRLLVKVRP
jgi:hypothetical protein